MSMIFEAAHDLDIWQELHGNKPFISWRSNKGVPKMYLFDQPAPNTMTKEWQYMVYDPNPRMTARGFQDLYCWNTVRSRQ